MPFHSAWKVSQIAAASRVIHRLESGGTPKSMINYGSSKKTKEGIRGVNPSRPTGVSPGVELVRMLALQKNLRFSIARLLSPVSLDRRPSVVPHDGRRAKANSIAPFE